MAASLLGLFGLLASILAALGIYGVLTQVLQTRRREIGIRIALGAGRRSILRLALHHGMLPVWIGVVLGSVTSFFVARSMTGLLYGLDGADVRVLAAAAGVLVVVALGACVVPSRLATLVDPIIALREE